MKLSKSQIDAINRVLFGVVGNHTELPLLVDRITKIVESEEEVKPPEFIDIEKHPIAAVKAIKQFSRDTFGFEIELKDAVDFKTALLNQQRREIEYVRIQNVRLLDEVKKRIDKLALSGNSVSFVEMLKEIIK